MIRLMQAYRVWKALRDTEHRQPRLPFPANPMPLVQLAMDARFMHDTAVCAMLNASGTYDDYLARLPPGLCPCQGAIEDPGPTHIKSCWCRLEDEGILPAGPF